MPARMRSQRVETALDDGVACVEGQDDVTNRSFAAIWAAGVCQQAIEKLGRIRTDATRALHEQGYSYKELAELFGVSRSRIQQLIEGDRRSKPSLERYRPRCSAPKQNGEQCSRGAVYTGHNGKHVCGTHARYLLDQGIGIEMWTP